MNQLTTVAINSNVARLLDSSESKLAELHISKRILKTGATIYDFGVNSAGSLQAGLLLSTVCLADLAKVQILAPNYSVSPTPLLQVSTDHAWLSCMASQYAGWPVQLDSFFGMGSGPMRIRRGREKILEELLVQDTSNVVVGVLETEQLPDDATVTYIAEQCNVQPQQVVLCVAPTASICGTMQIVARSVETALHKIHNLGGDVKAIYSAVGWAPLPPPAKKFLAALGRTNDAILYGGHVTLWARDASSLLPLIDQIPSSSSIDFGRPFADIFSAYGHDFYKVDPKLFAPAMITINDLATGESHTAGKLSTNWDFCR